MTNKTKRQLRAEAVERLKSERLDHLSIERTILGSICPRYDGRVTPYLESCRDALIDLLTDEEPPEGDAVAVLREAAHNVEDYHDAGEALRRLTDTTNVYYALDALADMVERDYVHRDVYDVLVCLLAKDSAELGKPTRSGFGVTAQRMTDACVEFSEQLSKMDKWSDAVAPESEVKAMLEVLRPFIDTLDWRGSVGSEPPSDSVLRALPQLLDRVDKLESLVRDMWLTWKRLDEAHECPDPENGVHNGHNGWKTFSGRMAELGLEVEG